MAAPLKERQAIGLTYKLCEDPGEKAEVTRETSSKGGRQGCQDVVNAEHVLEELGRTQKQQISCQRPSNLLERSIDRAGNKQRVEQRSKQSAPAVSEPESSTLDYQASVWNIANAYCG